MQPSEFGRLTQDNFIDIIEGPSPIFEPVNDGWTMGLNESPDLPIPELTRFTSFNGPALVERCYRAWRKKEPMYLKYRNELGLETLASISAIRNVETPNGYVVLVWVVNPPPPALTLEGPEEQNF